MKDFKKIVLPKNTKVSEYFEFENNIFEEMKLPDGRIMIQIVHTWGDGEIMNYGFQYKDGVTRKGINPLHIVGIYKNKPHTTKDLRDFLNDYHNNKTVSETK